MKWIRSILLSVVALSGGFSVVNPALAQDWHPTSAPNRYWDLIVSSSDGNNLTAFSPPRVYTSTDSGASWMSNSLPPNSMCASAASSADGVVLVVGLISGGIYTSTNSGVTWISNNVPFGVWRAVACSATGNKLTALSWYGNMLYTSTNAGRDWVSNPPPSTSALYWGAMACSADGVKLAAAAGTMATTGIGRIYTSSDSGATWQITSAPATNWCSIACSSDGRKLVAAAYNSSPISYQYGAFISTNSGTNWTAMSIPTNMRGLLSVVCSSNGNNLVLAAGDYASPIYTSTNSGATWLTNTAPVARWRCLASSADGSKLAAGVYGGLIYTWHYKPTLRLLTSTSGAVVSWATSTFARDYVLQQTSDLDSVNWTAVGLPVSDDGTNISVSISPLVARQYFRLLKVR